MDPRRLRASRAAVIVAGVAITAAAGVLLAAWRISRPAGLPQASCGQAVTHDLDASTQILSADPGALRCFDFAARRCTPASIEVTQMDVDAGTRYVIAVGPGGTACQVTGLSSCADVPAFLSGRTEHPAMKTGRGLAG